MNFVVGNKYRYVNNYEAAEEYVGQIATCESVGQRLLSVKFPNGEIMKFDKVNFEEVHPPKQDAADNLMMLGAQIKWHRQMAGALQQVKNLLEQTQYL